MQEIRIMPDGNPWGFSKGDRMQINSRGTLVDVAYESWNAKYGLPETRTLEGVKKIQNVVVNGEKLPAWQPGQVASKTEAKRTHEQVEQLVAQAAKRSRFGVNQRFRFIEDVVDMVIKGKSNSVIISGSGGLGKTYTVLARLRAAGLVDKHETEHECDEFCSETGEDGVCPIGDYVFIKGFSTPKGLYRALYENRSKIVVCDDLDSVWEHPAALNLLKSALDSYDTRRVAWLSEMKGDDALPRSFRFTGRIIFVSNLSLLELDQAVLSRCLYVDVSMTREEKVERIEALAPSIRPDLDAAAKAEALELMRDEAVLPNIGDLNIRTFLKILEIRDSGNKEWRQIAEYVVTAL